MKKYLGVITILLCLTFPAIAGDPGGDPPTAVVAPVALPAFPEVPATVDIRSSALVGRDVTFALPPDGKVVKESKFSVGDAFGALVAVPSWIIGSVLDLAAGTFSAGGQALSVVSDAGLGVFEAGSDAMVDTGEIVELGSNKMANRIASETGAN